MFFLLSFECLDMKAFVKSMKKILSNVSDEMLEALFLKVDADCEGSITWAAELGGLHDAGVPGTGDDEEEPVLPALPPSHEDCPLVRSLWGLKGGV
ncbi:hypothetical protein MC885_001847 [Smutsia gigantea]|nr:hypothetical protein MC885_001847 [Smutsia gigantea]